MAAGLPDRHCRRIAAAASLAAATFLTQLEDEIKELLFQDMRRLAELGLWLVARFYHLRSFELVGSGSAEAWITDGWQFAQRSHTSAEIIKDLYALLREAAGDALLIGCNTVGHLAAGSHEIQRTGDDTSGKHWERTRRMRVAAPSPSAACNARHSIRWMPTA